MLIQISLCCVLISAAAAYPQQYNQQRKQAPAPSHNQAQGRQQFQPPPPQQEQQQFQAQNNARPTQPPVPIISLDNNINYDGSYKYSYEGGDGTRAEQFGSLKSIGPETGEVSQGSYSYVGDDGRTYSIQYTADETGYHPVGDHLPQPPPIPEAILKSLEYLATAPPPPKEEQ